MLLEPCLRAKLEKTKVFFFEIEDIKGIMLLYVTCWKSWAYMTQMLLVAHAFDYTDRYRYSFMCEDNIVFRNDILMSNIVFFVFYVYDLKSV